LILVVEFVQKDHIRVAVLDHNIEGMEVIMAELFELLGKGCGQEDLFDNGE
jgi:hypothetical protein